VIFEAFRGCEYFRSFLLMFTVLPVDEEIPQPYSMERVWAMAYFCTGSTRVLSAMSALILANRNFSDSFKPRVEPSSVRFLGSTSVTLGVRVLVRVPGVSLKKIGVGIEAFSFL
jgi:hypothetical protein